MGMLSEGLWQNEPHDARVANGHFNRHDAQFRNWVTADGTPGLRGEGGFRAEPGRYHLYVSHACPWAHRTSVFRRLKGLTGPVSVPVLWDKQRATIVSNESSEIIRMFNRAFDEIGAAPGDYYPAALRAEIDAINARIYETVNNGVYRCGFATSQEAYDAAVMPLFETFEWLERRLATQRFLCANTLTEADWRLFTTLVRLDPVYHGHFKCNLRRLADYPNLWAYTRELYQHPGIATTVDFDHIKHHYYGSQRQVNPSGIVPRGPIIDLRAPHARQALLTD